MQEEFKRKCSIFFDTLGIPEIYQSEFMQKLSFPLSGMQIRMGKSLKIDNIMYIEIIAQDATVKNCIFKRIYYLNNDKINTIGTINNCFDGTDMSLNEIKDKLRNNTKSLETVAENHYNKLKVL